MSALKIPLEKRFFTKIVKTDKCWIWTGFKYEGYGKIRTSSKTVENAHRVSWKIHKGTIPPEIYVLHSCDNPSCVNPDHLWLGTHKDNMRDMVKKGRSSSPIPKNGHNPYAAKLDENQIKEIRRMFFDEHRPQSEISKVFHIDQSTVSLIVTRKRWKHI